MINMNMLLINNQFLFLFLTLTHLIIMYSSVI